MKMDRKALAEDHPAQGKANNQKRNRTGGKSQPLAIPELIPTGAGEMGERIRAFDRSKPPWTDRILGEKHPWVLGQPGSVFWKEIWDILQPLVDTPFQGGPATWNDDIFLELN